ncbi:hypothetical protein IC794_06645 [Acinetobacter seifertii]|uniref:hypothetical protein n=1 Tax=Acinetobacter seifertii TaxID=1530123 RepID=UPI00168AF1FA|nr:hypothetical protein [Acinetobacter seifertii]QNX13385.1 hypothetical protein IC794_06355 [Acinetobacter seifertii]QNX13433.1 hypothetical protein IC794_06645 [Acinetobacter seifertii]QNX99954.1 hypothetical protein IC770_06355 [Acinetobacter seifertii]QNY03826.1 hypothetical protein IC768_06355 [Acinetobacter seifertii]QNY03879.1 hypothetical protein IC768_06645 [Acinetobacter seifertii]
MAIKAKELISAKFAENSQTTQFIAQATTAIDKFTVTNTSASVVKFSANLVVASATAGASNLIIKEKQIAAGDTYICPELVGHNLAVGSSISTLVDTSSALVIRASGREIT